MNPLSLSVAEAVPFDVLRPDVLFGEGPESLSAAFTAATNAVADPLKMAGMVLLLVGLVQGLIRLSGGSPQELMTTIARVLVLGALIHFSHYDESRKLVPDLSNALAQAVSRSDESWKAPAQKVGRFAELMYPAGDLKGPEKTKVEGSTWAGWFSFGTSITDKALSMLGLAIRSIFALVILSVSFVALYIGWVIGVAMVWISTAMFQFGWMLVPLALGALGIDALRGIGHSYLLGLTSVGMGQFALALAHVGTDALMRWVAGILVAATNVPSVTEILKNSPDTALRQNFLNNLSTLPVGGWIVVLLATLVLALWVIITPLFAWKVFMSTMQNGTQFGSRLGFAFMGAALKGAANATGSAGAAASKVAGRGAAGAATAGSASGGDDAAPARSAFSFARSARSAEDENRPAAKRASTSRQKRLREGVAKTMRAARARGGSDAAVRKAGRAKALSDGATRAEADAIVQSVEAANEAPPTPPSPSPSPASSGTQTASASVGGAAPASRTSYSPPPPPPSRSSLATPLALSAAVLDRASAHLGSEEIPEPTSEGYVAARRRAREEADGEES